MRRIIFASLALASALVGCAGAPEDGSREAAGTAQALVASPVVESFDASAFRINGVVGREQRTAVARTGAAIERIGSDYVTVRATPQERAEIEALGFDVQAIVEAQAFPPGDSAFHDYAELGEEIVTVANAHPEIVSSRFSIGRSYEGRELWAVKISDNVNVDEDEPEVMFLGLHHAREHLTVEMTLYILHLLAEGYGTDEQITSLVNSREVYLVFDVNPDGGEYDIETGIYREWRKNRQVNPGSSYVGTDLNRNYGFMWGCCGGSSTDPASETYRGATAFSSPEMQRIRDFVSSRVVNGVQQLRTSITFHTFSELVLWPMGYTYTEVPKDMSQDDHDVFVTMGEAMAGTNGYTPQQSSDLYITDGSYDDWAYGVHKIFAYTFEMYPTSDPPGFYPPDEDIPAQTSRNRQAVLYLLEQADCPYRVIGKATQYCSGPRPATAFYDDFETNLGWVRNPDGKDTATSGLWERGVPQATNSGGAKQLGTAVSDMSVLVTGRLAGSSANSYDVDGGTTTMRSPDIALPQGKSSTLSFYYYFAHGTNSSSWDRLRVKVVGSTTKVVLDERGAANNDNGAWDFVTTSLNEFAGQTVYLLLEATDGSTDSLVEAAIDSVKILSQ